VIRVENHGSIFLLHALNTDARLWLVDNAASDATWIGPVQPSHATLVVEPRYVADIVAGAREAGLEVV
jgi:hypothetical protein